MNSINQFDTTAAHRLGVALIQALAESIAVAGNPAGSSPEPTPPLCKRRYFTHAFKQDMARRALESGNVSAFAREHDLKPKQIFQWIKQYFDTPLKAALRAHTAAGGALTGSPREFSHVTGMPFGPVWQRIKEDVLPAERDGFSTTISFRKAVRALEKAYSVALSPKSGL